MLQRRVGRLLIELSLPAGMGMIVYCLLGLVDSIFIARLGAAPLAAITLSMPAQILISSVAASTGVGLTSLISRTLGSGDVKYADNAAWHGLLLSIIYGLLFMLAGSNYVDNFLLISGCTAETFRLCREYLHIILLGSIFTFIPIITGSIMQGEGNTVSPILFALLSILLNVILDPIFIFGWGFIEGQGLNGAALATVLAQLISSFFILGTILRKRDLLSWSIKNFRPRITVLAGIGRVGLPAMLTEIVGVLLMLVLNKVLAGYGCQALAVLGIFLRVRSLAYMPVFGLTQAIMPIVGFAYGARKFDRVKESIVKAAVFSLLALAAAWFIMQKYPWWIMSFFSSDPELLTAGANCMRWSTLFLPLMGPVFIISAILQALGKAVAAMCLSLIRQLVLFLLPLLVIPAYWGLNGVWLVFSLSELLSAVLAMFFLLSLWQDLQLQKSRAAIILLPVTRSYKRLLAWLRW
ncbi:MAG: MATE family efflux transporter [Syntrophomonadaceae bacterium]|nr:MATE family efflux transporter [Syntrophomonadaceae bacterium]